jgi:hypothetical protein
MLYFNLFSFILKYTNFSSSLLLQQISDAPVFKKKLRSYFCLEDFFFLNGKDLPLGAQFFSSLLSAPKIPGSLLSSTC